MKAATVALLAAISTFGCTAEPRRPSPQAESYLNAALDLILEHAMHRDQVDAEELRDRAMEQAAGAELPVDTYPAIRGALVALGDGHSLLELSKELADAERARGLTTRTEAAPALKTEAAPTRFDMEPRMLDTDAAIAYVNLPSTGRWNIQKYAETLSAGVSRLIAEEPCGWIVDLRGNGGGNMWPMLAGIGAVLGEASPGAFVESGEVTGRWFYREGAAGVDSPDGTRTVEIEVESPPATPPTPPPAAVLIGSGVGSSGEALAIAFSGRPRTRFFGSQTYGLTSVNRGFRLADGANLVLAVGANMDRDGTIHIEPIDPDEVVEGRWDRPDGEQAIAAATRWLTGEYCR